ncbi:MAG: polyketide cyclase [Bacteroidota bacterium]
MRTILISTLMILSVSLLAQKKNKSNKNFEHTVETNASSEAIWQIWTDVNNWKSWDIGLSDARMDAEFKEGNKGLIISLEGRKSKFKIMSVKENESYIIRTRLPLGSLYLERVLSQRNGRLTFTHKVWFKGVSGGLFAKLFGEKFRQMLPEAMENINNLASK